MRLSEYVEPELVVIGLESDGVEDTIDALVDHLGATGHVSDPGMIRTSVLQRERSHTTSLGNGVALPHTTTAGVRQPILLIATAPDGIAFGADTGQAKADRLFFLLLSPTDQAGSHIKILARIVRLVRNEAFVEKVVAAESRDALIREIEREDALHV